MADVKRLNYFDRQFLRARDFLDEQAYHLAMRRQHNRLLHSFGVVSGLELTGTAGSSQARVSAGVAIDTQGREISLAADAQLQNFSGFAGKTVFVTVRYDEQESDPTSETGLTGNTRVTEGIRVEVIGENPPADAGLQLILGRLTVAGDGTVGSVDTGVDPNRRRTAGIASSDLRVRSLSLSDGAANPSDWPTLRMGALRRADLTGALSVTGDISAGGMLRGTLADDSIAEGKLDPAARGKLVTGGNAHDHSGGAGATIKHSALNLDDGTNPHRTTAADVGALPLAGGTIAGDLTVSGALRFADNSIAEAKLDSATRAKLVTGGNAHDHSGGDGGTVKHSALNKDDGRNPHGTTAADVGALPAVGGTVGGNLGIGVAPGFPLDVGGGGRMRIRGGANGTAGSWLFQNGSDRAFVGMATDQLTGLWGNSGASWGLVMDVASGNVGIGTLGPNARLDVANLVRFGLNEGASGARVITFARDAADEVNAGKIAYKPGWDSGVLGIVGAGKVPRRIRMWDDVAIDGKLGIGTITPTQRLHVVGAALIQGPLIVTGGKSGYIMDQFVNALDETLEDGDVVVISGNQSGLRYGLRDAIPIPEVDLTSTAGDTRVCGIVCEVHGAMESSGEGGSGAAPRAFGEEELAGMDRTKVLAGQSGWMVTLGAYAHCKVDADIASISPGDLLATSPTRGHAQKCTDRERANGAILGKALAGLDRGRGKIPVLVSLH